MSVEISRGVLSALFPFLQPAGNPSPFMSVEISRGVLPAHLARNPSPCIQAGYS